MNDGRSLADAWIGYDALRARLSSYIKRSEQEFAALIEALDACWSLADEMMEANGRLSKLMIAATSGQSDAVRESMTRAFEVFRRCLVSLEAVSRSLPVSAQSAQGLLGSTNSLQESLEPLRYISFFFRLEGARLAVDHHASLAKVYEEMQAVAASLRVCGESQQLTLTAIYEKLMSASQLVASEAANFSHWASDTEEKIQSALCQFADLLPSLFAAQERAVALGNQVAQGIQETVKALQGHDSIQQRLEHVLSSLETVRSGVSKEPGAVLIVQRLQAKAVLEMTVAIGASIREQLRIVIDSARSLAEESSSESDVPAIHYFEQALARIGSVRAEIHELLTREIQIGRLVVSHITPINQLLSARGGELETLAESMKMLALNVLVGAEQMSEASVIAVLGGCTSEAAGKVLETSRQLNEQFTCLDASLREQTLAVGAELEGVEASLGGLQRENSDDELQILRNAALDEVGRLRIEALEISEKTEDLLKSLKFVDEGRELFEEFDLVLGGLVTLYPEPEEELHHAASAGYVMQAQYKVHAVASGRAAKVGFGRVSEAVRDADYGNNVELF